jgi:uncharacterized protein (DUF433 family)
MGRRTGTRRKGLILTLNTFFMKIIHVGWITRDKEIMMGKPCIKGTRITVELILKKMSEGASVQQLLEDYPHLTADGIYACVDYARAIMINEQVFELPV